MPVRPVRPPVRPVATAAKPRIRPPEGVLKPGPPEAVNGEAVELNDSVEKESAPAEETLAAAARVAVAPGDRPTVGKPLMRSVPKAHSGAPRIAGAAAPEDFTLPVPEKWAKRAESHGLPVGYALGCFLIQSTFQFQVYVLFISIF